MSAPVRVRVFRDMDGWVVTWGDWSMWCSTWEKAMNTADFYAGRLV